MSKHYLKNHSLVGSHVNFYQDRAGAVALDPTNLGRPYNHHSLRVQQDEAGRFIEPESPITDQAIEDTAASILA